MKRFDVVEPGSVGLIYNTDRIPYDLPPQGWNFAHNVRFFNNDAMAARGWLHRVDIGEKCEQIDYNAGIDGNYWIAYGQNGIYTIQDALVITEASRRVDPADPLTIVPYTSGDWQVGNFQGVPIATNDQDMPQAQFHAGTAPDATTWFLDLSNGYGWPGTDTCKILVGYKNFLVALNITESGTNYPTKIRWSDAAAPGNLPTDWSVGSASSLSREIILRADTGPIVAAEVLRDDLIVYTANAVFRLTYTGGPYVMQLREVTTNFGAFGPHSVIQAKGIHLVLTRDDLGWFDGNSFSSLLNGKARVVLQQFLISAQRGKARICYHSAYDEIWFGMVISGSFTVINVAAGTSQGAIAQRQAPYLVDMAELPDRETTDRIAFNAYGWNQLAQLPDLDGWDKTGDLNWNTPAQQGSPDDYYVIGLGKDGDLYRMDYGYEYLPFSKFESILEKTDLNITGDENTSVALAVYPRFSSEQLQQTPTIRTWDDMGVHGQLWDNSVAADPDFSSYAWNQFFDGREPARLYIGSQQAAGEEVQWRDGKEIIDQRKVTGKARGVRHGIKIVSQGVPWRLSGYAVEYVDSGRR